jgi:Ca2+-binding RTX toxin-like protein
VAIAAIAVAALVLLPAVAAQAGTLEYFRLGPFSSWTYTASSSANSITITAVGSTEFRLITTVDTTITIVDANGNCILDPNCGCTIESPSQVRCPKARDLTVLAGSGDDTVTGDLGSTSPLSLLGEGGGDRLTGGGAGDVIDGGSGVDTRLEGGGGNDIIRGGASGDSGINGGSGTDTFSYNDGRTSGVTASLAGTNSDGDGALTSIEVFEGSPNDDTLSGNAGANTINGIGGDDILVGAAGVDALNGGADTDTASYADGRTTDVAASLAGGNSDGDVYTLIENLTGGVADDSLSGDAQHNVLDGGAGDDVLRGAGGQDHLKGGPGRDLGSYDERTTPVVAGLAGTLPDGDGFAEIEGLRGGGGDDTLSGDSGENRLEGGPGDDVLIGGAEDDDLIGGGGRDTASYEERATPVVAGLQDTAPKPDSDSYVEIRNLRGGAGGDTLTGDDSPNTLDGGAGADALTGLGGIDELRSGEGDDSVNAVDGSPDSIDCGNGADGATIETFDSVVACEAVTVFGAVPPPPDRDGDGYADGLDCNDFDAAVRPGALEVAGNAVDENCDRVTPDFPLIGSAISIFVDARARWTRITEVVVTAIVAGGSVEARCTPPKGKRKACPFKLVRRSFPSGRRKLVLTSIFKKRRLPVRTVIEIRVLGPNAYGKLRIEKIAKNRTTRQTKCLRPGVRKPVACPLG